MNTLELPVVASDQPGPTTVGAHRTRRRRWAPQDRPAPGLRIFVGLLGVTAMLTTATLLLSDRAPGILRAVFGERAQRLWARIDADNRLDAPAGAVATEVTQTDFVVHVALWTVVAVLAGLAVWTWRGLVIVCIALASASVALELAQGRLATTRAVEATDAAANLVGIAVGATIAGVCYLVWSGAATARRRLSSRPT